MSFEADFIRFPAVQKFWKSVKIRQSYKQLKGGNFFWDTSIIDSPSRSLRLDHFVKPCSDGAGVTRLLNAEKRLVNSLQYY